MLNSIKVLFSILLLSTLVYADPIVDNPVDDVEVNEDAPDTIIDLAEVFTDPDNDDSAIEKSIESNTNPDLVTATVFENTLTLDYQDNQNTNATISILATSNGVTVIDEFTVTVNPVNDEPSFEYTNVVAVNEDSGLYEASWAFNISVGPDNESDQIPTFEIISNDHESYFSIQPSISELGVLTFTPADNQHGEAIITVRLTDNGGTENGGVNTYDDQTFTIKLNPIADTPNITDAETDEDIMSSSGLVITRNAVDSEEVTHFKITGITNGTLYQNNGSTSITNNEFITFFQQRRSWGEHSYSYSHS